MLTAGIGFAYFICPRRSWLRNENGQCLGVTSCAVDIGITSIIFLVGDLISP